jgi:hypothetical protein
MCGKKFEVWGIYVVCIGVVSFIKLWANIEQPEDDFCNAIVGCGIVDRQCLIFLMVAQK